MARGSAAFGSAYGPIRRSLALGRFCSSAPASMFIGRRKFFPAPCQHAILSPSHPASYRGALRQPLAGQIL